MDTHSGSLRLAALGATLVVLTAWAGRLDAEPTTVVHGHVEDVRYCARDGVTLADIDLQLAVTNRGIEPLLIDRGGWRPLIWYVAHSETDALAGKWVSGVDLHHLALDPPERLVKEQDLVTIPPGRQVTLRHRAVTLYLQTSASGEDRLSPGVYKLRIRFRASSLPEERARLVSAEFASRGRLFTEVLESELIDVQLDAAPLVIPCESAEREDEPSLLQLLDRQVALP